MELSAEEKITKLLSEQEIIKNNSTVPIKNTMFDLGTFLENSKNAPKRFGNKYVFIR